MHIAPPLHDSDCSVSKPVTYNRMNNGMRTKNGKEQQRETKNIGNF